MGLELRNETLQPNSEYAGLSDNLSNQLSNHSAQLFQLLLKTKKGIYCPFYILFIHTF